MSPEVGRELLELDGEAHVAGGLVAGEQQVGGAHDLAAVGLLARGHQVQLVELVLAGGPGPRLAGRGADQVQTVPYLGVEHVAPVIPEPARERHGGERGREGRESEEGEAREREKGREGEARERERGRERENREERVGERKREWERGEEGIHRNE